MKNGYRVLLVDNDPQSNASVSLGIRPEELKNNLATAMYSFIENDDFGDIDDYLILKEGIHVFPSNIMLSAIETKLVVTDSREWVLKSILDKARDKFDYIIIDCMTGLGLLVKNALTASDSVIIPIESNYLCSEGLESTLDTIAIVKKKLNSKLNIEGILFTKHQARANHSKNTMQKIHMVTAFTYSVNL